MPVVFNPNDVYMGEVIADLLNQELVVLGNIVGWYTVKCTDLDKKDTSKGLIDYIWLITSRALIKVVVTKQSLTLTKLLRENIVSVEKNFTFDSRGHKQLALAKVYITGLGELVLEKPVETSDYENFASFVNLL